MSKLDSRIFPITVSELHNADRLEIARVRGYQCVVGNGQFRDGDLVAYIPEQSIVPDNIIEDLGLTGRLAGPAHNRVRIEKIRGVISQGLCYPVRDGKIKGVDVEEGQDVTDLLGLIKYDPPVPKEMDGQAEAAYGKTIKYELANVKMYPDAFEDGETVVIKEKLHGVFACFGKYRGDDGDGEWIVHSNGLGWSGHKFSLNDYNFQNNIYVKMFLSLRRQLVVLDNHMLSVGNKTWHLCGEIFGRGVQDLNYGEQGKRFSAFDLHVTDGDMHEGYFLDTISLGNVLNLKGVQIDTVPSLYQGPYSHDILADMTTGMTLWGNGDHGREGVVIRPLKERTDMEIDRVILKSISEKYLLRKGGTEYK